MGFLFSPELVDSTSALKWRFQIIEPSVMSKLTDTVRESLAYSNGRRCEQCDKGERMLSFINEKCSEEESENGHCKCKVMGNTKSSDGGRDGTNHIEDKTIGESGEGEWGRLRHEYFYRGENFWDGAECVRGRLVKPGVHLLAHGVPNRVDRIKCLGNAVVSQQAAKAWQILTGGA